MLPAGRLPSMRSTDANVVEITGITRIEWPTDPPKGFVALHLVEAQKRKHS
jgi:hypothetical protein